MKELLTDMHRFIFERSLNLFDFWYMTTIATLAAEYSSWWWLALIPCIYVSIKEYNKL